MSITNFKHLNLSATARSSIENWPAHYSSSKHKFTTALQRYQTLSQENDKQCYRSNNFDWKIQRRTIATNPNEADRIQNAFKSKRLQRQSMQVCGLKFENPCFSHGQLYIATRPLFVYNFQCLVKLLLVLDQKLQHFGDQMVFFLVSSQCN